MSVGESILTDAFGASIVGVIVTGVLMLIVKAVSASRKTKETDGSQTAIPGAASNGIVRQWTFVDASKRRHVVRWEVSRNITGGVHGNDVGRATLDGKPVTLKLKLNGSRVCESPDVSFSITSKFLDLTPCQWLECGGRLFGPGQPVTSESDSGSGVLLSGPIPAAKTIACPLCSCAIPMAKIDIGPNICPSCQGVFERG